MHKKGKRVVPVEFVTFYPESKILHRNPTELSIAHISLSRIRLHDHYGSTTNQKNSFVMALLNLDNHSSSLGAETGDHFLSKVY